jgi:UDP-N-acetylglucosamine acyltransferase
MIHETAVIYPGVIIEEDVIIGAGCIIGAKAEHKKFWHEPQKYSVIIKSGSVIHGNVTIDAGTFQDTIIENYCFIMKGVHIGHDCLIKNNVTISPHSSIGGEVVIEENTNIGMGVMIHQGLVIPSGCMFGMGTIVTKKTKLENDTCFVGNPARKLRSNKR